ncbi:Thrombospondin type-1 domain-containing protein 7A [Holothuria leucospilota]|uniref:Thrombospondin type-1 domain-containing protein 7A n=1 Tax=Holothuria leucospilota TaxID=206669 RepID=A0A9Q1CSI7_HOLLE|nr:Thrombospondin type-1 domain-containing protein 7A [Holothuria leucospilota]
MAASSLSEVSGHRPVLLLPFTKAAILFLLYNNLFVQTSGDSAFILEKDNFKWYAGPWQPCSLQNITSCVQRRTVNCRNGLNQRAPPTFCKPLDRPKDTKPCFPCPEDCLLSAWTQWSECTATCSPVATRIRTRTVLREQINQGDSCGDLSEFEICEDLPECGEMMGPVYTWRTGEWTSCRKVPTDYGGECGLGERIRSVACIDESGRNVPEDGCLDSTDGKRPFEFEICTVPCDCVLSEWTDWSPCSQTCQDRLNPQNRGIETRQREIKRIPEDDGLPCAHLMESRECELIDFESLPECPTFEWITQEWQDCIPTEGECGGGKEWRQVYCVKYGDMTLQPVDEKECLLNDRKPLSRRACWKDCPIDCQLGEWQNWSPCSKSCGEGGYHLRSREILTAPAHGGEPCDAQYQAKECEVVECAWWRTGAWSICFLNNQNEMCGDGEWYRVVYCISARDTEVDASNCAAEEQPLSREDCKQPCPEHCIVSEWSKWSPCSVTCGKQGGIQTRWKEILAYGADPDDCLPEDQLIQTRVCNLHVSCDSYIWQIGSWEECVVVEGEPLCGEDVGIQKRNVTCEIDSGVPANHTLCPPSQKPETHQPCSIACPVDCMVSEWSEWSECNQTCGKEARQERSKVILSLAANGGAPCPNGTDDELFLHEYRPCDGILPCYTYKWFVGNWSECLVARDMCGQGLQVRNVSCQRSDLTIVDPGFCVREILGPVPHSHQPCFIACGGDCELTDWTSYGPCRDDCGHFGGAGYCRTRTRQLHIGHPEHDLNICPHLSTEDLVQSTPCTDRALNYTSQIGPWSDCNIDGGCGIGKRSRSVVCRREDGQLVPNTFCHQGTVPPEYEDCTIECPRDCVVSDWLSWSSCSQRCGTGLKVRNREVMSEARAGGKECPHLTESSPCHLTSCDAFLWTMSDWSSCQLINKSSICGPGFRNRSVSCPAGEEFGADCAARGVKPPTETSCYLPCVGDCVVSEWSEFSPCSPDCDPVGHKTRSRSIIRPPSPDGLACPELNETIECGLEDCHRVSYRLDEGDWTNCKPHHGDCGPGVRWQIISCVEEASSLKVNIDRCNHSHEIKEEDCLVPCPVDCEYDSFSDWSRCSHHCGTEGVQMRSRKLLTESKYGGRTCVSPLNQTRPCNIKPCYNYSWLREPWSACLFDSYTGCGVGVQTRRVECLRSDGLSVALEFCILPEEAAILLSNDVVRELNMSSLDVISSRTCEKPCPGDCVVSDWSEFSACYGSCFDTSIPGSQTRSRHILVQPSPEGFQCPEQMVESKAFKVLEFCKFRRRSQERT